MNAPLAKTPLHLFEGFGVELEYMIVDRESLDIRPIADAVLRDDAGQVVSDVEFDRIAWSNELALHVIELKTNGPAPDFSNLSDQFHEHVQRIEARLESEHARLMPTGMHPWMHPHNEFQLWPYEYSSIYGTYDRIFDCHGHGWANLQSVHLNLPFADDAEFGRLHAAIRLLLPILPALAASSPIIERKKTDWLDTRLEVYRTNAKRIPSIIGRVIPEPVYTHADYDEKIFQPMYQDIAPKDPEGLLQHEFLNSRGAIARFERNAIEIRVLDVQECPQADVAICRVGGGSPQDADRRTLGIPRVAASLGSRPVGIPVPRGDSRWPAGNGERFRLPGDLRPRRNRPVHIAAPMAAFVSSGLPSNRPSSATGW